MDNGAAEGLVFGTPHLYHVAEQLQAHEIVVPDTLYDYNDTIAKGLAFTRYTRDGYRYMVVAQGNTLVEFMQCIDFFCTDSKFMYASTIGIPRLVNRIDPFGRAKLTEYIIEKDYTRAREFHFLGAWDPFDEVAVLADYAVGIPELRGIDTSAPGYVSMLGMSIEDPYTPRPDEYFKSTKVDPLVMERNLATYLAWARYNPEDALPARESQNT